MTDDAENYLGYIKDGDEAKRDAYVSKMDASKQESIKQGLEQQKRDYQRFPDGYEDAPEKKLTQEQLNLLGKINELEEKYKLWEKTKEKATKMLWWDDVAKGLAKQKQQTQQSDATTENSKTAAPSTKQTETSSTPATLSQNGKVWFMHPIGIQIFNFESCMCNKCITEEQFKSIIPVDVLKNGLFHKMNNNLKNISIDTFLSKLNSYFIQYNVTSCLQKAHFISQILCESDFFRTSEEYKNRDGSIPKNWNNYSGGSNYHGRGLIQITHDYNYKSFGKYIKNDLIKDNPDLICSDLDYTIKSAFWYWIEGSAWGNVNNIAANNDFLKVTMAINGGYNHVADRNKALITLYNEFNIRNCKEYHDIKVDNYSFATSAMINSKWYKNNTVKVQEVEAALSALYADLQHRG